MEENDKKAEGEAKPTEDAGKGDKPTEIKSITDANAAAERLEKANAEAKELNAIKIIGGGSPAGTAPEEKKEETPIEYAKRIVAGEPHA